MKRLYPIILVCIITLLFSSCSIDDDLPNEELASNKTALNEAIVNVAGGQASASNKSIGNGGFLIWRRLRIQTKSIEIVPILYNFIDLQYSGTVTYCF